MKKQAPRTTEQRTAAALKSLADKCSRKEYCTADIRKKLEYWELPEVENAKIMQFLQEHHFIDDSRYARNYAEDKFRFNHWGKQKIALMLRQKGISTEVITEALQAIPEDNYAESCLAVLLQKQRTLNETDPYKRKAKLIRFALGKGFDFDTVQKCIDRLPEHDT